MDMVYESPDRGKTVYARAANDYSRRWLVDPPRRPLRSTPSALGEAAGQFARIERKPTTPAAAAAQRAAAR